MNKIIETIEMRRFGEYELCNHPLNVSQYLGIRLLFSFRDNSVDITLEMNNALKGFL